MKIALTAIWVVWAERRTGLVVTLGRLDLAERDEDPATGAECKFSDNAATIFSKPEVMLWFSIAKWFFKSVCVSMWSL